MSKLFIPLKARITKIKNQTKDVKTYNIKLFNNQPFYFKPGQFNMISILGFGEAPISISSPPYIHDNFDHTIRSVGSVTKHIEKLKEGDIIGIRGPYGNPWPMEKAKGENILIITGGIGIAPLRPAITHIFHNRNNYKKIQILYGARNPEGMLFTDEFSNWRKEPNTHLYLTVDKVPEYTQWNHKTGVVTALYDIADMNVKDTVVLICGPEIMMRFACKALIKLGFFAHQIFISMERRMKCGVGKCGHCQLGSKFVCKDGPVFSYNEVINLHDTLL